MERNIVSIFSVFIFILVFPYIVYANEPRAIQDISLYSNLVTIGVLIPQSPHGDGVDDQFGANIKYMRRVGSYGPLSFSTGALVEYHYIWSADSVTNTTWKRENISLTSMNMISYHVTNWFSFGIGASLGVDIQKYSTGYRTTNKRTHVGTFFSGNLHSSVRFSYKMFVIELEARSFDRFKSYGGGLLVGVQF